MNHGGKNTAISSGMDTPQRELLRSSCQHPPVAKKSINELEKKKKKKQPAEQGKKKSYLNTQHDDLKLILFVGCPFKQFGFVRFTKVVIFPKTVFIGVNTLGLIFSFVQLKKDAIRLPNKGHFVTEQHYSKLE